MAAGLLMLLGFLTTTTIVAEIVRLIIKKSWQNMTLYLNIKICKTNMFSEYTCGIFLWH